GLIRSESILPAGNPDAGLRNSRRSALFVCSTVGLVGGLVVGLVFGPVFGPASGPVGGLAVGLVFGLSSGGWYVLLQRLARRRAARQNLLPRHPIDFLEDLCRVGLM